MIDDQDQSRIETPDQEPLPLPAGGMFEKPSMPSFRTLPQGGFVPPSRGASKAGFSRAIRQGAERIAADNAYEEAGLIGKAGIAVSEYYGSTIDMLGESMRFTYEAAPTLALEQMLDFAGDIYQYSSGVDDDTLSFVKDLIRDTLAEQYGVKTLRQLGEDKQILSQARGVSTFDDNYISPDLVGGAAASVSLAAAALLIPGAEYAAVPAMAAMAIDSVYGEYATAMAENPGLEYDWKVASALGLLVGLETIGTKFALVDMPKMMANRAFKKAVSEAAAGELKKGFGKKLLAELGAAGVDGIEELAEEELEALVQLMYLPEYQSFRDAVANGDFSEEQWKTVGKILLDNLDARTVLVGAASYGAARGVTVVQNRARWYDFERGERGVSSARKTEAIIEDLRDVDRERLAGAAAPIGTEVAPDEAVPAETPPKMMDLTPDQLDRLADRLVAENRVAVDRILTTKKGKPRKSGRQLAIWSDLIPADQKTNQTFRQDLFERLIAARDRADASGAGDIGDEAEEITEVSPDALDSLESMQDELSALYERFGAAGIDPRDPGTPALLRDRRATGLIADLERFQRLEEEIDLLERADPEFSADQPLTTVPSEDLDVQPDTQMGSMPGGIAVSRSSGKRYYVKRYSNREQIRNEAVANELYRLAGVAVPNTRLLTEGGEIVGVASEMVEGLVQETPTNAGEGFIADAWLANWDVVGLDADNLLSDADGRAVRIDQGGALTTRAQGDPKGEAFTFGNEVVETRTLREMNEIFSRVSPANIRSGLDALSRITDTQIRDAVESNSTGDRVADQKLISTLIRRKRDLLGQRESLIDSADAEFSADVDTLESEAEKEKLKFEDGKEFDILSDDDLSETEADVKRRVESRTGKRVRFVRQTAGLNTNGFVRPSDPDTIYIVVRDVEAAVARLSSGSNRLSKFAKDEASRRKALKKGKKKVKQEAKDKVATEAEVRRAYEDYLLQVAVHENFHLEDVDTAEGEGVREAAHRALTFVLRTRAQDSRVMGAVAAYRQALSKASSPEDVRRAERTFVREVRAESVSDMFYLQHSGTAAAFFDRGLMSRVKSRIRKIVRGFGKKGDVSIMNRLMINAPSGNIPIGSYPSAASTATLVNLNLEELGVTADDTVVKFGDTTITAPGVAPVFPPAVIGAADKPSLTGLADDEAEFSIDQPYDYTLVRDNEYESQYRFEADGKFYNVYMSGDDAAEFELTFNTGVEAFPPIISDRDFARMSYNESMAAGEGERSMARTLGSTPALTKFPDWRGGLYNLLSFETSTMDVLAAENPGRVFATIVECCRDFVENFEETKGGAEFQSLKFTAASESARRRVMFAPRVSATAEIAAMTAPPAESQRFTRKARRGEKILTGDVEGPMRRPTPRGAGLIASELRAREEGSRLRGGIGRDTAAPSIDIVTSGMMPETGRTAGKNRSRLYLAIAKRIAKELGFIVKGSGAEARGMPGSVAVMAPKPPKVAEQDALRLVDSTTTRRPEILRRHEAIAASLERAYITMDLGGDPEIRAGQAFRALMMALGNLSDGEGMILPIGASLDTPTGARLREQFQLTQASAERVDEAARNYLARNADPDPDGANGARFERLLEFVSEPMAGSTDRDLTQLAMLANFVNVRHNMPRQATKKIPQRRRDDLARGEQQRRREELAAQEGTRPALSREAALMTFRFPEVWQNQTESTLYAESVAAGEQTARFNDISELGFAKRAARNIASDGLDHITMDRPRARSLTSLAGQVMTMIHPAQMDLPEGEVSELAELSRTLIGDLEKQYEFASNPPSADVEARYQRAAERIDAVMALIRDRFEYSYRMTLDGADPVSEQDLVENNAYVINLQSQIRDDPGQSSNLRRAVRDDRARTLLDAIDQNEQSRRDSEDISDLLDDLAIAGASTEFSADFSHENMVEDVPYIDLARAIENPTPENLLTVMAVRRAFGSRKPKGDEFAKVDEDEVRSAISQLGVEPDDDTVRFISENYFRELVVNETLAVSVGKMEAFSVAGQVERAMSRLFDSNPSPTADELSKVPGAPAPAKGVKVVPMKGVRSERRVESFIRNVKRDIATADGKYAETDNAEEIESLLRSNDVVMFTGDDGPVIHANNAWLDRFATPKDYATVKAATIEAAGAGLHNWYREFGRLMIRLGGERALNEAAFIFGVTSAQSSVETNLADTLRIMTLARRYKASGAPWNYDGLMAFFKANSRRPNAYTQGGTIAMFVTEAQLKPVVKFYIEGMSESKKSSIKTRTYSGNVAEMGANNFFPFSVQDRHQAAMYGFFRGSFNDKTGTFNFEKKFGVDNETRYANYLTARLAMEPELRGLTPSQIQSMQWFSIKAGRGPYPELAKRGKSAGSPQDKMREQYPDLIAGTIQSAEMFGAADIQDFEAIMQDPSLSDDVKYLDDGKDIPSYLHVAQGHVHFGAGQGIARRLAETMREGAPGVSLYGVPTMSVPGLVRPATMDEISALEMNMGIANAVTESDGSIRILNELGIPHTPLMGMRGRVGRTRDFGFHLTPLLGSISDPATAKVVGSIAGVGLMQPRMATLQPSPQGRALAIRLFTQDGSRMTDSQTEVVMSRMSGLRADGEIFQSVAPANGYVEVVVNPPGDSDLNVETTRTKFNQIIEEIEDATGLRFTAEGHRKEVEVIEQAEYVGNIESSGVALAGGSDLLPRILREVTTPTLSVLQANEFNFNRSDFAQGLGIDEQLASEIAQVEFSSDYEMPDIAEQRELMTEGAGGTVDVSTGEGIVATAAAEAKWWDSLSRMEKESVVYWTHGNNVPWRHGDAGLSVPEKESMTAIFYLYQDAAMYTAFRAVATGKYGSWHHGRVFGAAMPINWSDDEAALNDALGRGISNGLRRVFSSPRKPVVNRWIRELLIDDDGNWLDPEIRFLPDAGTHGLIGLKYDGNVTEYADSSWFNYDGQNYILLGAPSSSDAELTVSGLITSMLGQFDGKATYRERLEYEAYPDGNVPYDIDNISDGDLRGKLFEVPTAALRRVPWLVPDIRSAIAEGIYGEVVKVLGNQIRETETGTAPAYRALLTALSKAPAIASEYAYRSNTTILPEAFVSKFSEGDVFRIEAPASMSVSAESAMYFGDEGDFTGKSNVVDVLRSRGDVTQTLVGEGTASVQAPTVTFVVDNPQTARAVGLGTLRGIVNRDDVMGQTRIGYHQNVPEAVLSSRAGDSVDAANIDAVYASLIRDVYTEEGESIEWLDKSFNTAPSDRKHTLIAAEIASFMKAIDALGQTGGLTPEQVQNMKDNALDPERFFVGTAQDEAEIVAMPGSTYIVKEIKSNGNLVILEEITVSDEDAANIPVFAEFSADVPTPGPDLDPEVGETETTKSVEWRDKPFRRAIQDRFIELDYLQRDLAEAFGRTLDIDEDALNKFRLIPGQLNHLGERFEHRELIPLGEEIRRIGLTMEEFGEYAVALHALAVNADLRSRSPAAARGDIDSGMSDAEARRVINAMITRTDVDIRRVEEIRRRYVGLSRRTLRIAARSGLITETEFDTLTRKFPDYVPMWNAFDDEADAANEQREQFIIPSSVLMARTGRTANALAGNKKFFADRLAAVADQRFRVMRKAAQNEALKRLLRLTKEANNSELLEIYTPGVKRRSDKKGNIRTFQDNSWRTDPTVFSVMVGGQQVLLRVKHPGLATAIKAKRATPGTVLRRVMQALNLYTSVFRFFTTQFGNPGFTIANPIRDIQTAGATLVGERGPGLAKQTEDGSFKKLSLVDRLRIVVKSNAMLMPAFAVTFGIGTEATRRRYAQYRAVGGRQGFYRDQDPVKIRKKLARAARRGNIVRNVSTIAKSPAWLWDKVNVMFDDGIRFAVWNQLVNEGVNPEKAAETTRDLTVDFSKMGTLGPNINAAYAYANASVQGPVKTLRLLKSPAGAGVFGGFIVMGMLHEMLGDDDEDRDNNGIPDWEEIPQYQRDANFMIPIGEGFGEDGTQAGYVSVPVAYGLDIPFVMGRRLVRMARQKDTVSEGLGAILSTSVTSMVPGGAATLTSADDPQDLVHSIGRILMPDIVDPMLDLAMNRDWLNNPIYQENPYDPLPNRGYQGRAKTKDNLSTSWAAHLTEWMNDVSGGNEAVPGMVSVQPEWLTYMLYAPFGGTGKTAQRGIDALGRKLHNDWLNENFPDEASELRETTSINDIPGLRRLIGITPREDAVPREFFEMRRQFEEARTAVRRQEEMGLIDEADATFFESEDLLRQEREFKDEKALRKEMKEVLTQMKRDGATQPELKVERQRFMDEIRDIQEYAVKQISERRRATAEAGSN